MKKFIYYLLFLNLFFIVQLHSCPTKFACELLEQGKISMKDLTNLDINSLDLKITGS